MKCKWCHKSTVDCEKEKQRLWAIDRINNVVERPLCPTPSQFARELYYTIEEKEDV